MDYLENQKLINELIDAGFCDAKKLRATYRLSVGLLVMQILYGVYVALRLRDGRLMLWSQFIFCIAGILNSLQLVHLQDSVKRIANTCFKHKEINL